MRIALAIAALMLVGIVARAAELSVDVTDARGRPAADSVIALEPVGAPPRSMPEPASQLHVIDQKDEAFVPYVEVLRPGDSVVFANSDGTRHHVYSFSPAKTFEFVLKPGERSPAQVLASAGTVAVGCNIHDRMITYLHVTAAAWVARTDAAGRARLADLPQGEYRLTVWHPQLRPGATPPARSVVLDSANARQHSTYALPLLPDPRGERDLEQGRY